MPLYYLLVDRRMESVLGVHEYRLVLNTRSLDEWPFAFTTMLYSPLLTCYLNPEEEDDVGVCGVCSGALGAGPSNLQYMNLEDPFTNIISSALGKRRCTTRLVKHVRIFLAPCIK